MLGGRSAKGLITILWSRLLDPHIIEVIPKILLYRPDQSYHHI